MELSREHDRQHRHDEVPAAYYEEGVAKNIGQRFWHRGRQRIIRRIIATRPRPRQLVDLGCHSGWLSNQLQVWTGAEVIGLDFAGSILAEGRTRHPNVDFRQADLEQPLPLPDASADWITAFDVLEHLQNFAGVISEVRRVLRPGGTFICAIPSGRLFNFVWWWWMHWPGAVWRDLHEADVTADTLTRALENSGLHIEEHQCHFFGMYHVFISRKRESQ